MDIAEARSRMADEGFCVLEGLLDPSEAERLDALARPLMAHQTGYVKLEGALNPIPDLAPLCIHPEVLALVEHLAGENFRIANNACVMWCQPGAPVGPVHSDWPLQRVPQPWPRWPMLVQTMWMLTDFTPENGATRVAPGSHLAGHAPNRDRAYPHEIPATGRKGSVLVWHGALWHRNGPNTTSDQHRVGVNVAYIPWVVHRPPEAWPLVRRDLYERFPERLRQLLERSVERA